MADPVALIIGDDRVTAAQLAGWLAAAGWAVAAAEDGPAGLRRIQEGNVQAVVADVALSGVDGCALCAHLRLRPYGERLRVVLVSARADAKDAALAAGADAFFALPLDRDALLGALVDDGRLPDVASAEPGAALLRPGPVRVPRVAVLGADAAEVESAEEGALAPGLLLGLLERLHAARFSGVLEVSRASDPLAKIYFSRGRPAAARSSDPETGFGQVALALGVLSAEHLAESVEEGRRSGTPLGEVLLRSQLVERRAVERVLREQVIRRVLGAARGDRYVLDPAEPIGLAAFEVHPGVVAWRLAALSGPDLPSFPDEDLGRYVRPDPLLLAQWSLLDPDNELGLLRALVVGGATARDSARVGGARALALLAVLRAWDLVRLAEAPPPAATREAGLAELDGARVAEEIASAHRAMLDASHYTVLGLPPDADADDVSAATVATLARYQPELLPAAVDTLSRERARAVYERALEAGRVLSDPARRAIYDARLAGELPVRVGRIGMEDHAVLQADRAREFFQRGEFVTAAALFHMAIQLEGEAADILAMLGWARHNACVGDPDAGEPELRRALALDPEDECALFYLGQLLAARGERDEARRLLRAALDANPEFDGPRAALRELDR